MSGNNGAVAIFLVVLASFGGATLAIQPDAELISIEQPNVLMQQLPAVTANIVEYTTNQNGEVNNMATNLAPIPEAWDYVNTGWRGIHVPPLPSTIVYPVTWQGKTCIRMDRDQDYINEYDFAATNEMNAVPISLAPGKHVVLKAWFWVPDATDSVNFGVLAPYAGGCFNIDLRRSDGVRICAIGTSDGQQTYNANTDTYASASAQSTMISNFGTKSWEQVVMDFVVQGSYISDGFGGLPAGESATPGGMSPLIALAAMGSQNEYASIYVADIEIYVDPELSQVEAPTFNPPTGTFDVGQQVSVGCVTPGAAIYYTVDGSTPTTSSTLYTGLISIGVGSTTLKAIAVKSGYLDSNIATAQYLVYVAQYFTLDIRSGTGGYTNHTGIRQYLVGQGASVTAYPNENYSFSRWLLNGVFYTTNATASIVGAANTVYVLQPEFTADVEEDPDPTTWALTITTDGHGSSPVAGHYLIDVLSLLVSAIALPTYKFKQWLLDGALSTDNPLTITAAFNTSHTLHAQFEPNMTADPLNPSTMFRDNIAVLETVDVPTLTEILDKVREVDV